MSRHKALWPTLLGGLLLRLLLMPFTAHSDLLHMYWMGNNIISVWGPSFKMQAVLAYFHAAWLRFVTWTSPAISTLFTPQFDFHSAQDWFTFVSQPQIYRALFAFKLPYLLFDVACALLLYHLASDRDKALLLFRFWWWNPLVIFAVYIFGRHEPIAIFFVLLSLYLIRREHLEWGLLALGAAIAIRYYAFFLLPFYVLSMQGGWAKRLERFALGLAPWLVVNVLTWVGGHGLDVLGLVNYPSELYLLPVKFPVAAWDNLYIFPLVYFLLLLHGLHNRAGGFRSLVQYSTIALLLLFSTAYIGQSPQYWTWFVPLLAIQLVENRHLVPLHLLQIISLAVYSLIGSRAMAGYLFAPIAPTFFWSLPSPIEVVGQVFPPELVISLAHTAFSAITIWMAYLVFRQIRGYASGALGDARIHG